MLRRVLAVVLILPVSTSGCSFLFTETVPDNPTQLKYFDCTSTPGLAVADGVIAVSNTVGAVTILTKSKQEYADQNNGVNRNLAAGITIGIAAVVAASGIYGLVQSERCRRAKNELEHRLLAPEVHTHPIEPQPVQPPAAVPPAPAQRPSETPATGQGQSVPGEIKLLEVPEPPKPPEAHP